MALARKPPPPTEVRTSANRLLGALERHGLLLRQDKALPSAVTLLAGEPHSGSWWSHPQARLMFRVLSQFADHPDVLVTKLLSGKDTFVHRTLWPALLAVSQADEPWQLQGLSAAARRLLSRVRRSRNPVRASGVPARELLTRLLVHAQELHTEGGRHEIALCRWSSWAAQAGVAPLRSAAAARATLEEAAARIGAPHSALPWG